MIIDYKYHIASLVAVFLALGIGIIIGSTML
ncbi:MAG: copper transporter, partial [Firmicutes bacterium]|nr:copper transporter [Bacillota bacterium]